MIQTMARVVALLAFAIIAYATFSTISARPGTGFVAFEREMAFVLLGAATMIGFPTRFWLVALTMLVVVFGLELAQHLTPDRHGRLSDALQKLAGAAMGVALGLVANYFRAALGWR